MDEIKDILGDGQARVSATADIGNKDFGRGISASFTVSLSCNQDAATVARAAEVASRWARQMVRQHLDLADAEYKKIIDEKGWKP